MNTALNNMFSEEHSTQVASSRGLAGTAELTSLAATVCENVLKEVSKNVDSYKDIVAESQKQHSAMDELISIVDLNAINVDFLRKLDETTLENMLKSQQSKRSRNKGKRMTLDNYKSLMNAAVAEALIRKVLGKEKQEGSTRRDSGSVDFSPEELIELQADQERLKKELRNVQSKKSIMKTKVGFSESDEKWLALLKAEQQLKAIRHSGQVMIVDETKDKLAALLADVNINDLKASDAKKLIEEARQLLASNQEVTTNVDDNI